MTSIFEELGIPKKYLRCTDREDRFIALVHRRWLKSLVKKNQLVEFVERPRFDSWPYTDDELGAQWTKIFVCVHRKRDAKVLPLPRIKNGSKDESPLLLAQLLQYINQTNFKNLWKESYKNYCDSMEYTKDTPVILSDYNNVLRDVISRIYGCSIVNACDADRSDLTDEVSAHGNLVPAVCGVETLNAIFLIHIPYLEHTLNDCINFSPAILDKCFTKPLFIVYQILQTLKHVHNQSITLGNITLSDIYLTDDLWLQIFPQVASNLSPVETTPKTDKKPSNAPDCRKSAHKFTNALKCENCGLKTYDKHQITDESLEKLCKLWVRGQISNFTYLSALNEFAGRKIGDPNRHHVFPWVTDFASRSGKNWRDLRKSKYRLNKGDNQLDMQYENSQSQVPHHVSDVLSAITYYIYTARRTPKSVLCKHVRPVWVPAEYPSSIQRLQEWTPDECIPEFFSDPGVFKSVHEDLEDLEVPVWSSSPEDFVEKHREILESAHVSERLHHWIDLTFGYKLFGNVAVKAKNVCLHLVDEHTHLTKSGIVQLFTHPHPPKIVNNTFWWKTPPKLLPPKTDKHRSRDRSNSSAPSIASTKSDEDEITACTSSSAPANRSPLVLSKLLSRSRNSLNGETQKSRSPSSQRNTKNPSHVSKSSSMSVPRDDNDTTIYLYKDYKAEGFLESYEKLEGFLTKVFHTEESGKFKTYRELGEIVRRDECTVQNAFTNQIFADNFEARLRKRATTKSLTFPIDGTRKVNARNDDHVTCNYREIICTRRTEELQVFGCLLVEIFMYKQLRCMIRTAKASFRERLRACKIVASSCENEIPKCVKCLIQLLLDPKRADVENFQFASVSDCGLPPPNPHQLVEPLLHQTAFFSKHFLNLYAALTSLKRFETVAHDLDVLYYFECDGTACNTFQHVERMKMLFAQNIGECTVKLCVRNLEAMLQRLDTTTDVEIVYILLPYVKNLVEEPATSILAAWYLFDPISRALGTARTRDALLESMLRLYDGDFVDANVYFSSKVIKLYHHSFLLVLIVRLGLKCFLENFVTPLVEAVGGYRDNESNDFIFHTHSEKLVRKTSHLKNMKTEERETEESSSDSERNPIHPDEIFEFDCEPEAIKSVIAHLELNVENDLTLDHSTAEEALDATIPENLEHLRNLEDLNVASVSSDEIYVSGVDSPVIPIPELCNISCDVGSKSDSEYLPDRHSNMSHFDVGESDNVSNASSGPTKCANKTNKRDTKISDVSADSLIWMSHRLGPVLTARYLTRNLLKMLTLCYIGKDNLQSVPADGDDTISIAESTVLGDKNASKVLKCLSTIAALYGEQFILLQYLPHMSELISLCKKKLTVNLEGGLISCLALLKYTVPFLSDASLMDHLQDVILKNILHPVMRLLGSTKYIFPSGVLARDVLAKKYLDTIYILSIRLGSNMTRTQLSVPSLQHFFFIFEKVHNGEAFSEIGDVKSQRDARFLEESNFVELLRDGTTTEWAIGGRPVQIKAKNWESDSVSPPPSLTSENDASANEAMDQLKRVFTAQLARTAYLPFLKHVGFDSLDVSLRNHATIQKLCKQVESDSENHPFADPIAPSESVKPSSSIGSNIALVGNRIDVQDENRDAQLKLVSNRMSGGGRHLRGNWLAYWEHEIGRSEKDTRFNFKQIRLQVFAGHSQSVKSLYVLDNENSFISGSRDKTVKLWSLRSQGDGDGVCQSQWTYTAHRKSILSLTFIQSLRLAASCDSVVHIWDPFMGVNVGYLESPRYSPVNVLNSMPAPSTQFLAATTEGVIKIVDARVCNYVYDLKIMLNNVSLIRCLAVSPSGSWVAAGQSSGHITVLDTRTGLVISTWAAHEGGVLRLVAIDDQTIISSSLDQTVAVWNVDDGKFKFNVRGTYDPVHCLDVYNGELISGTTGNRIGVHTSIDSVSSFSTTKLRTDAFKGLLTSMTVLPLNRLLLLGADTGNISLLC